MISRGLVSYVLRITIRTHRARVEAACLGGVAWPREVALGYAVREGPVEVVLEHIAFLGCHAVRGEG